MEEFKKIDKNELRKKLWGYMIDNPVTPNKLSKEIGIGAQTLNSFLQLEETERRPCLKLILQVQKFLRDKGVK